MIREEVVLRSVVGGGGGDPKSGREGGSGSPREIGVRLSCE